MLKENGKWFQVSLRFVGDSLPVDEISGKLGIEYSSIHIGRKGERINNNSQRAKYQTNIWAWKVTADSSVTFEEQISNLLDILESRQQALSELLSLQDVEGELFLGFGSANGQGGAFFSAALLRRVAALNLNIELDLYPKSNLEEDEWRTGSSVTS